MVSEAKSSTTLPRLAAAPTPRLPRAPVRYPALSPARRPRRWLIRPTPTAAAAEPIVKKTVGNPEKRLEPNMSSASSAPTVMPAARPAPLRICASSRVASVRRCSGGSWMTLVLAEAAADPVTAKSA